MSIGLTLSKAYSIIEEIKETEMDKCAIAEKWQIVQHLFDLHVKCTPNTLMPHQVLEGCFKNASAL